MMQICRVFACQGAPPYRTVLGLSVTTLFFLLVMSSFLLSPALLRSQLARSRPPEWLNGSAKLEVKWTGLVVDTPSCQIPDFDPYNPSISPFIHDPRPQFVVCNHSLPVTVTDRKFVRLNTTLTKSLGVTHCLYRQVRSLLYTIKLAVLRF